MTKQEKFQFVEELTTKFKEKPEFYLIDMGGFSVSQANKFREKAFKANIEVKVAKNTLIKKAMENSGADYSEMFDSLKSNSAVVFFQDDFKSPAKLVKDFRGEGDKPQLKAAYVEETLFLGDNSLATLISLKTKTELLGEIVGLLQSPIKNVVGSLKGQGGKLSGLLKAIETKNS